MSKHVRVICTVALFALAAGLLAWQLRVLPPEMHSAEEFGIEVYRSQLDTDGDGVDDQTDILSSARAYIETNPVYKSAYYADGRPDDGCGVCTDVIDQALLGAGYDLRALVDEDIRSHPELYGDQTPDDKIDFRRVRNLRVWFPRHATQLTLDTSDISAWQGGDIVCWPDHIGIVSDMRNANGQPLVIHHGSPYQLHFEEDVIDWNGWGEIVGHWRLG